MLKVYFSVKKISTNIEEIIDKYIAIDDLLLAKRLVTSKKINDGDYDFAMNISQDLSNELALEYIKSIKENYVRRNITDSCIEIINIDKSGSNTGAIKVYNKRCYQSIEIRQCK